MPSLTSLMTVSTTNMTTGEIKGSLPNNMYVVRVQGQDKTLRTAVPSTFPNGTMVLVAKTGDGEFIIGKSTLTSRNFTEVVIRG